MPVKRTNALRTGMFIVINSAACGLTESPYFPKLDFFVIAKNGAVHFLNTCWHIFTVRIYLWRLKFRLIKGLLLCEGPYENWIRYRSIWIRMMQIPSVTAIEDGTATEFRQHGRGKRRPYERDAVQFVEGTTLFTSSAVALFARGLHV
jgi:hypothetical protein